MKYIGREIELPKGRLVWLGEAEDKSGIHLRLKSTEGSHSQISLSHEAMRAIIDLYNTRDAKLRAYESVWKLMAVEMADGAPDYVSHKDDSTEKESVKWTAEKYERWRSAPGLLGPDDAPENLDGFNKPGAVFKVGSKEVSREEGLAGFRDALNRRGTMPRDEADEVRRAALEGWATGVPTPPCEGYQRSEGVMGGPCLNCGRSQPEHAAATPI